MSTDPTGEGATAADRRAAFELLRERFGVDSIASMIELAANAAHVTTMTDAKRAQAEVPALRLRAATHDEIRAALALVPGWLEDVDSAQRALIVAARHPADPKDPKSKALLTWNQIGLLLGFPPNSAKQRARQRANRLGIPSATTEGE